MKGRHTIRKSSSAPKMLAMFVKTQILYFLAPSSLKDILRTKVMPSRVYNIDHAMRSYASFLNCISLEF